MKQSLAEALDALAATAITAGLDADAARTEGESLAATVAEPATGAFVDWAEQTGRQRSAELFMEAASRGRRFRVGPTPLMSGLSASRSVHAPAYASALSEVALAACGLGEENPRVLGNATTASAAQLGTPATPPGGPGAGSGVTDPPVREPVPGVADELADHLMGQLRNVQRRINDLSGRGLEPAPQQGGGFDLGDLAAGSPGAFDLTGSRPDPLRSSAPPTEAADDAEGAAPDRTATQGIEPVEPAAQPAEPEEEPKSVEELLAELDALVGLETVKGEIHRQAAVLRIEGLRKEAGLKSTTITRHMIFNGNPGTGKTTVARLVAGIYRALGLLSKGQLVEVDRSELVAGYLGQTATKTAEICASAEGGVLFIDEAYSLAGDQYGTEAIDTLVKEMEDKRDDLVVIVAGYPVPMMAFVAQNPGLESRFRTSIDFEDYTDDELASIFELMAGSAEYDVSAPVLERLRELLAQVQRGPSFGNARWVRNLLEAAIGRHAWRLRENEQPTLEELRTLEADDLDVPEAAEGTDADSEATVGPTEAVDWGDPEIPLAEPVDAHDSQATGEDEPSADSQPDDQPDEQQQEAP